MTIPILPPFTRWSWRSLADRKEWAPRFEQARRTMNEIERLAVREGILAHVVQYFRTEHLVSVTQQCARQGLILLPVEQNEPHFRCVITTLKNYNPLLTMVSSAGPACCQIEQNRQREAWDVDDTFDALQRTHGTRPGLCTSMWRPMGIRLLPYTACHANCDISNTYAHRIAELAIDAGHTAEVETIKEVLSWPVKANRLFGIAEFVSPVLKFYTRTTWTPTLETYDISGQYRDPKACGPVPLTLYRSPK